MADTQFRKAFLLFMVAGLTIGLVIVLRGFLMTILIAALLSGLLYPFFTWLTRKMGNRPKAAAGVTVLLTMLVIIGPIAGVISLVVGQASSITESVRPAIEKAINEPTYLDRLLRQAPGYRYVEPHRQQILETAGAVVNSIGRFLMTSLQNTTRSTVSFLFHFVIALYTIFFLLLDGPGMLKAILNHLPLHRDEKETLKERFVSITRATIKGTIIIGAIQGVAAGIAFWVAGVPNAAFWTVVMIVMSILPLIGAALIWVPAAIFLFATGHVTAAILLSLYCSLIVGSIDNVLRPRLVGKDTRMHDVVVLFSTLGGLAVFGPLGFILGPVIAGLFVTSWEIFGQAYSAELVDGTPRIVTANGQDAANIES